MVRWLQPSKFGSVTCSGVTRGVLGDTLQGGDTRRENVCGQIYKEYWRNEVGHVKRCRVSPSGG